MFAKLFKSKSDKISKKGKEISLIVENGLHEKPFVVKLPKRLLVESSTVFKKMADNGELKKSKEVKMEEITSTGLQKIAEYLRKESVFFQNHYEAIETLKAAYIYQMQDIQTVCSDFLITIIDRGNVCEIYEFASNFSFYNLEYHCLRLIDQHSEDILKSPGFLTLKKATVMDIIKRHTLNITKEIFVFRAILTWGLNECLRQGVDAEKVDELLGYVRNLLEGVRFMTMTKEELVDPDVDSFYKMLHAEDSSDKRKSLLSIESRSRASTVDSFNLQSRKYEKEYVHVMEIHSFDKHPVKSGESFFLKVEILKGRVFLTAITLGFDTFVAFKNTACLYVTASATNVQTTEQKCARGTFLNSSEDEELAFPSPLVSKESETIEIVLNVKRAENICPMVLKNDIQFAIPDTKDVAMKITQAAQTGEKERNLFKNIKYFF